jgi:predicted MFS family arabinose efflux permease
MSIPSLTELIPVLQMAIGPVILISGVGLLLLSMTNRLGRVIDRARLLYRELRTEGKVDRDRTRAQLQVLNRRAVLMRQAIILASVSALLAALLIISLFLVALLHLDAGWLILLLFIGCLASLIGSLIVSIRDINQSLRALKLESGEV